MDSYSSVVDFGMLATTHDNFIRVTLTQTNYIMSIEFIRNLIFT